MQHSIQSLKAKNKRKISIFLLKRPPQGRQSRFANAPPAPLYSDSSHVPLSTEDAKSFLMFTRLTLQSDWIERAHDHCLVKEHKLIVTAILKVLEEDTIWIVVLCLFVVRIWCVLAITVGRAVGVTGGDGSYALSFHRQHRKCANETKSESNVAWHRSVAAHCKHCEDLNESSLSIILPAVVCCWIHVAVLQPLLAQCCWWWCCHCINLGRILACYLDHRRHCRYSYTTRNIPTITQNEGVFVAY